MTDMPAPGAFAAMCHGVGVPPSPFLHDQRIRRINAGRYEGQEIGGALAMVRPGDRVLELGAGLGVVGAVVAKNASPERVQSYEANPNLIPHIQRLYADNGLGGVISVRNEVLVGPEETRPKLTFNVHKSYLGSSLLDIDKVSEQVEVPATPLAEVMAELNPQVLLVDIEGGELEILKSIDLTGVRAVVMEFHPDAYGIPGMRRCKGILRKAGFAKVEEHSTRHVWTCARKG